MILCIIVYVICLALVTGLGYFGGGLVYGTKPAESKASAVDPAVQQRPGSRATHAETNNE